MKKIGILTFHRLYNYGSVLQAFALNKFLNSKGYVAQTIDMKVAEQLKPYQNLYEPLTSVMSIFRNLQLFFHKRKIVNSRKSFDNFLTEKVVLSEEITPEYISTLENNYDLWICGSDQIWNIDYFGHHEAYFLSFVKEKKKCIAYAASMGVSEIPEKYIGKFKRYLEGFLKVTVREGDLAEELQKKCGLVSDVVLDPVFLIDKDEWEKQCVALKGMEKYIFCYYIGNVPRMREFAYQTSKELHLPMVVVRMNLRDLKHYCKKKYESGPVEFLSLVRNAECVITNSYHAVAFSLIFHKQFRVFVNNLQKGNSQSRIVNLLKKVKLDEFIIRQDSMIEPINRRKIDFSYCEQIIKKEQEVSRALLVTAIESYENN